MSPPWILETPARYLVRHSPCGDPYYVHELADLPKSAEIGRFTYVHGNSRASGDKSLLIGSFCSIASGVRFQCGDEHDLQHVSTFPLNTILGIKLDYAEVRGDGIVIGNDVWIAEGVRVLSGSKIDSGVIIGASSLVKGHLRPYGIYAGSPAKLIRMRFSDHIVAVLNELCWWGWPLQKIMENVHFFNANLSAMTDREFDNLIKTIK